MARVPQVGLEPGNCDGSVQSIYLPWAPFPKNIRQSATNKMSVVPNPNFSLTGKATQPLEVLLTLRL